MTVSLGAILVEGARWYAITQQRHYPCMCHDWVLREDRWELIRRAAPGS